MRFNHFKVFTGNANPLLAAEICYELGCPLAAVTVKQFSDGEVHLQIQENVRGADVFVVQPTCTPVDKHLMELLLMMDALKRASAERITAVLPYYGYARQDRKDRPRMPISARLVASLLERAGANRILALDLHAALGRAIRGATGTDIHLAARCRETPDNGPPAGTAAARQIAGARSPHAPARHQQRNRLEQVGLAAAVRPEQHTDPTHRPPRQRGVTAEIGKRQAVKAHAPMCSRVTRQVNI